MIIKSFKKTIALAAFFLFFIACISKKQPTEIALPTVVKSRSSTTTVVPDSLPPQNLSRPKDESHNIRGRFILMDSLETTCNNGIYRLHLFRIKKLERGYYPKDSIYICSRRKDLYQFNNHMYPEAIYWWVLTKTEDSIQQFPIYRHSGNF